MSRRVDPLLAPYVSICMIVRNACSTSMDKGWNFEKTLQTLRARLPDAEIVIVDTQSSDDTPEVAQRYADVFDSYKGPKGDWTKEMYAFDDAAAARAHSFSLSTGRWVLWIDADDELADGVTAEKLLRLNGKWKDTTATGAAQKVVELHDAPHDVTPAPVVPTATAGQMWMEDALRLIDENYPDVQCLVCPYLYRSDDNGLALDWQQRERIIKRNSDGSLPWSWREAGHEVMVPNDPSGFSHMHYAPGWLWVHHKLWNAQEAEYSLRRHFKILHDKYLAGERSSRNLLYLVNFTGLIPEHASLQENFARLAIEHAHTPLDLMRAWVALGQLRASQGLYLDAKSAFASAVAHRGDLPDAWLAAGDAATSFEDHVWAVDSYRRAIPLVVTVESQVNPRAHLLTSRAKLIGALTKVAESQVSAGSPAFLWPGRGGLTRVTGGLDENRALDLQQVALSLYDEAATLGNEVYASPAVGPDVEEAFGIMADARQRADTQRAMLDLWRVWKLLIRSDETKKAMELVSLTPAVLENHPLRATMRQWAALVITHLTDDSAYSEFYQALGVDDGGSPPSCFEPGGALPRAAWIVDHVSRMGRAVDVLEIGPYDGPIAALVLKHCDNVRNYYACDASARSLELLRARVTAHSASESRLRTSLGSTPAAWPVGKFDVVICCEMIEHVPDPGMLLFALREKLRPGGVLFLSTPWMAYDKGMPKMLDERDPRGHVRAMTLREVADGAEEAGLRIVEGYRSPGNHGIGDTMHVRSRLAPDASRAVTFAVPGALWPWNSTKVKNTGMGASEETIVYLADALASGGGITPGAPGNNFVEVYGPVNDSEVESSVRYWPVEQLRHARPDSTLVVSRAPSWTKAALERMGIAREKFAKRVLWLQDVGYPDLNEDVASYYDDIVCLTDWHKRCLLQMHDLNPSRLHVIGNFLLRDHFAAGRAEGGDHARVGRVTRRPYHFIYASSPDRALIPILEMWPRVLENWPEATLDIFYGWEGAKKLNVGNPAWTARYNEVRRAYDKLKFQTGVRERGRINHVQLARELESAAVWWYPVQGGLDDVRDTPFAEAGCLTAIKARAAGAIPVIPPYAALAETGASECTQWLPDVAEWHALSASARVAITLAQIRRALDVGEAARETMMREAIETHDVSTVLDAWWRLL